MGLILYEITQTAQRMPIPLGSGQRDLAGLSSDWPEWPPFSIFKEIIYTSSFLKAWSPWPVWPAYPPSNLSKRSANKRGFVAAHSPTSIRNKEIARAIAIS